MTVYRDRERRGTRTIILADSMLKWCNFLPHAILLAIGGASVEHFLKRQQTDRIVVDWKNYDLVIINVGTNDVANGKARYIHNWITTLHRLIKDQNPRIKCVVNGILPRPCDFKKSKKIVVSVNLALKKWATKTEGAGFYPAYKSFTTNFEAKTGLFSRRDKLHLTPTGSDRMENLMKQMIRKFEKGQLEIIG